MNRSEAVQSFPVQQMMAAGNLNWLNISSLRSPSPHEEPAPNHLQSTSPFPQYPTPVFLHHQSQHLSDQSWSQLLLGGSVDTEEDRYSLNHLQFEPPSNCQMGHVKQENSQYGHGNEEYLQQMVRSSAPWDHLQVLQSPSPRPPVHGFSSNMLDFDSSKTGGRLLQLDHSSPECGTGNDSPFKKAKFQSSAPPTFKVRKEKLGDRITALHQLVSPFGKTDTASVLLEAYGYIRFLQNQVQALSTPYFGRNGSGNMNQQDLEAQDEEPRKDLRSRGLCLVPVSCTMNVGNDNGADYWTPLGGGLPSPIGRS